MNHPLIAIVHDTPAIVRVLDTILTRAGYRTISLVAGRVRIRCCCSSSPRCSFSTSRWSNRTPAGRCWTNGAATRP